MVITADGGYRRGNAAALKPAVDEAVEQTPTRRARARRAPHRPGRRLGRRPRRVVARRRRPPAGHARARRPSTPSTRCSSSTRPGTTGKPKGILHTTGGYLTQVAYTHRNVFDLKPDTDVYWCTADIGWVTGHSYIVYGPLANGATR